MTSISVNVNILSQKRRLRMSKKWEVHIAYGAHEQFWFVFYCPPSFIDSLHSGVVYSSRSSARRAAKRIAEKLGIEIEWVK
jgi:hypothetical protein